MPFEEKLPDNPIMVPMWPSHKALQLTKRLDMKTGIIYSYAFTTFWIIPDSTSVIFLLFCSFFPDDKPRT